jgi:tetratricopeptide (TPR) repeat protein
MIIPGIFFCSPILHRPVAEYPPNRRRQIVLLLAVLLCVSPVLLSVLSGSARAEPLYQQDPFDEVTLDKENRNAVLTTFPLQLADRKVPEELPQSGELELRLLDRPDQLFRVPWQSIKKVRLFEEMVLDEALQFVKDGNFDDADENFRFLERKYPQCPGLPEGVDRFLSAQMSAAYKAAHYDEALAALVELHRRNPQRKGLAEAWQRVANHLIEAHASAGNYAAARSILEGLSQRFPENAGETVEKWTNHFSAEGRRFLAEAREHLAAGRFRQAHLASTRMLDVWPEIDGGQELRRKVFARYPHVTVGVGSSYGIGGSASPDDWAVRRVRQLLQRPLLELAGFGSQGGNYTATSGSYETDEQRQRVTLRLDAGDSSQRGTTAARAARPLLSAIDPRDPAFHWGWARVVGAVSAPSLFELRVEFRRPQPRPEAWLHAISAALPAGVANSSEDLSPAMHPYRAETGQPRIVHFVAQSAGVAEGSSQPQEVTERHYATTAAGLSALRRGEISVLDRVSPWELDNARKLPAVTVEPYALPTVHCLAFNPLRPRTADRRFRRALAYGIHRQAILDRSLLAGQRLDGCQIITGPFPHALNAADKHGYAYDEAVDDYPHDPALAMVLAGVALQEAMAGEQSRNGQGSSLPTLELVHPPDEIARLACQSLVRQLGLLSIPLDLRELQAGESPGDNYDLLYVELALEEPVVDAARLFCPGGVAGSSTILTAACERLLEASSWADAVSRLHDLHRAAHQEVAVLPLWQLVEHFACHSSLKGIGRQPFGLYQNIGKWQCTLRAAATEP